MRSSGNDSAGRAAINGAALYYEVKGAGEAVLFLHAGVADCRMWDPQFEELSRTHRAVRVDLRGFGRSARPDGAWSHWADAEGLLGHLGVESAHVVGASFGGAVAIDLVLARPAMARSLVLASPAVGGYEFSSPQMQGFFAAEEEALARGDLEAAVEANLAMWIDGFGRPAGETDPRVRALVGEMQREAFRQERAAGAVEVELAPPALGRLQEIRVPTLVVSGDRDVPEFLALAGLVASRIPGARREVMHGCAHLPSMENPRAFNRLLRGALAVRPHDPDGGP